MNGSQTTQSRSESPGAMNYYVTFEGEIKLGPFNSQEKARDEAMDEAARRIENEGDASFGSGFHIEPEWKCIKDSSKWDIHHIRLDKYFTIRKYDENWEVGVFDSNHRVVDDMVATCTGMGDALATLCWYLTQTLNKQND